MDVIGQSSALMLGLYRGFSKVGSQDKADTPSASFASHAISISINHLKSHHFPPWRRPNPSHEIPLN
jgi:hypothetical protein